jgi:hypothetical protein
LGLPAGFLADSCLLVVGLRVAPKKPFKAWACALVGVALVALSPAAALAKAGHVENRCPKLEPTQYEELDARVQLLFKAQGIARALPAIICTKDYSWVEWEGEKFDILGRGPIADEVVDILERHLEPQDKNDEDSQTPAGQPALQRGSGSSPRPPPKVQRADPLALRPSDARGGGVTVGIETEIPSDTVGFATGPAFDFGSSVGPLLFGGREAFRVTVPNNNLVFMDFEGAVSYGAPLNPDALFGATLRFGAEWMVAYPEGNSGQAAVTPVVELGLRLGHSFGLVGLWFGLDARFRTTKLHLREEETFEANDVGASFTFGASLVDWSRK